LRPDDTLGAAPLATPVVPVTLVGVVPVVPTALVAGGGTV